MLATRPNTARSAATSRLVCSTDTNTGLNTRRTSSDANRAFIQWAGFTFGLSQSFYDFYAAPATSYVGSIPSSDTGDRGWERDGLYRAVRQRLVGHDLGSKSAA